MQVRSKARWMMIAAVAAALVLTIPAASSMGVVAGPVEAAPAPDLTLDVDSIAEQAQGYAAQGGCAATDPVPQLLQQVGLVTYTEDPTGGSWQPWIVQVGDVAIPAPPDTASVQSVLELAELQQIALNRTADQILEAQIVDEGPAGKFWTELYMALIIEHAAKTGKRNPPRLSREMAIVHIAMYDALVSAYAAKYCFDRPAPYVLDPLLAPVGKVRPLPSYPSEHATVAGVMSVVLRALFPVDEEPAGSLEAIARNAALSRLVAGTNYRSDVDAGFALGQEVGTRVLAARANDGANDPSTRVRLTGSPCNWVPTPPGFRQSPLEPQWGDVDPFIMTSGAQFRSVPPPVCDGPDYMAQTQDLYQMSLTLNDRQKAIARFWEGGQGTVTPPGISTWDTLNITVEHGLSTLQSARIMSYIGVAVADAGIGVWDTKFAYWYDRPVTGIRRLLDPTWMPYLNTPPFPGYISGHSGFSAAVYFTLGHFFPERAEEFRAKSTEAAMSRYYGGIHIRADNENGVVLGMGISGLLVDRARNDGAEA